MTLKLRTVADARERSRHPEIESHSREVGGSTPLGSTVITTTKGCGVVHHKRKRSKNRRAGCLLCKPWKANGNSRKQQMRFADLRRLEVDRDEVRE